MSVFLGPIVPIYGLIALGVVIRMFKVADGTWVSVLNRYGFYVGFPVLIFNQIYRLEGMALNEVASLAVLNVVFLSAVFFGIVFIGQGLGFSVTAVSTFGVAAVFGNIAFLGFPVITAMYPGVEAETSLVVATYVFTLFSVGIVYLELSREHAVHIARIVLRIVSHPFIIAIVLGAALNSAGVSIPGLVLEMTDMIAASVTPVVLVSLGVFAGGGFSLHGHWSAFATIVVFKMVILPLLALATVRLTGLAGPTEVTVLQAATPVAVTAFTLVSIYELDTEPVAAALVVTTALSTLTYPAFAALMTVI